MLKVSFNLQPLIDRVEAARKRDVPFAAAIGMTKTAQVVRKEILAEAKRRFDRPLPSTVAEKTGPLFLKSADYKKLRSGINDFAEVRVKDRGRAKGDPPIVWLSHLIYGGRRVEKRSEDLIRKAGKMPTGSYMVPASGLQLDPFGNTPRGLINRVLADLQAFRFDKFANSTKGSRARRKSGTFYFSTWPPNPKTRHLAPGIYERTESGVVSTIKPVFIFVKGLPRYRRLLPFHDIADRTARQRGPLEFARAMRFAAANPRAEISQLFFDV